MKKTIEVNWKELKKRFPDSDVNIDSLGITIGYNFDRSDEIFLVKGDIKPIKFIIEYEEKENGNR
jgi:hypothetical protein